VPDVVLTVRTTGADPGAASVRPPGEGVEPSRVGRMYQECRDEVRRAGPTAGTPGRLL